jgi:L-ascorbate 6-phosphate lactonase
MSEIHSTWDDWFVRGEVEAADPGGLDVWYLGCNGFVLRSPGATLYVDPYFADGDPPNIVRMIPVPMDPADATDCDAVLATHEHIDHMHPPSYDPLVNDLGADVYAPDAAYEDPHYEGDMRVPADRKGVIAVGDAFTVGDLTVHVRGANDPDAIEPVSFVVEHESGTFFHGGDSRPAPGSFPAIADEFDIDLGALAFGSVGNVYDPATDTVERTKWYMDENQIVEAANQLELDRLLPTHYDMWRGVGADPTVLSHHAHSFTFPRVVEHATIGDRFTVREAGRVDARSLR